MGKLDGKVAVVTGAARGIGREYAHRLAKLGADVGVIDINLKSYEEFSGEDIGKEFETVVDELKSLNVQAVGFEADISDEAAVTNAFQRIQGTLGDVDILIANAGGGTGAITENAASEINPDQLEIVLKRNFYGTVYSVKSVVDQMKKKKYGKIVTVTSVTGLKASDTGTYSHYAATKAAIVNYTKNLAQDLGQYNITVNAIAPGYIGTGRLLEQFEKAGKESYENETALKRLGTPEDCARVIEFLSTDLSDYVTGTVIDVTGGLLR
ncbi:3-oxoacyl-[acyl-carrier-protein] reductase [Oceanobacillus oncorhynchi subsp. oncorhynchi]|uniref:SDR family NAD(P)-dependent oxidoreductase n=1 Tax=Oceanobacillus oncorhynchi TaxID=545501 RepID=UPI0031CFF4A0